MATETEWDAGTTTWDVDVAGPGTRTVWDFVTEIIKYDELAEVVATGWLARINPSGWLARVKR